MKKLFAILIVTGALELAGVLHAQSYGINWHTISGGGGVSSGTNGATTYTLSGTIGQPAASTMSGGSYSLTGGFWSIIAAVQTSGSPSLTITRSGSSALISWGASSTGFVLQQSSTLAPNSWALSQATVTTNGTIISVTVPVAGGDQFFRLRGP